MVLKIEVNIDSDAFLKDLGYGSLTPGLEELKFVLTRVCHRIQDSGGFSYCANLAACGSAQDTNGNKVATWEFVP